MISKLVMSSTFIGWHSSVKKISPPQAKYSWVSLFFFFLGANESSQARGRIRAAAAGLHHSHSWGTSICCTHWFAHPLSEARNWTWILMDVGFLTRWVTTGTLLFAFYCLKTKPSWQKEPTVKRLHASPFDWFWCSQCSAASTFWNGIFPQCWDSQVDIVSLLLSHSLMIT